MAAAQKSARFKVHAASTDEEKHRVYRFRYETFVEEMGGESVHAEHGAKLLKDGLDENAIQLYLTADDRIAIAVQVYAADRKGVPDAMPKNFNLDAFDEFEGTVFSFTSWLTVAKDWRGSKIASALLGAAYKIARRSGSRFDFCACAPSRVQMYQRLGYRQYTENFVDEDEGYRMPLVLLTEDENHLRSVKSPFLNLARDLKNPPDTANWFERQFPDYARSVGLPAMSDDEFWEFVTDRLQQTPLVGIPLLANLSFTEAKQVLNHVGTVLRCKKDDHVVRAGDVGHEMFVLLAGSVEVRGPGDQVLASMARGDLFGEIALFSESRRTADVIAAEDSEVLVLTQEFLQRAMTSIPDIVVKVLFNLTKILCDRLGASTRQLIDRAEDENKPAAAAEKEA